MLSAKLVWSVIQSILSIGIFIYLCTEGYNTLALLYFLSNFSVELAK